MSYVSRLSHFIIKLNWIPLRKYFCHSKLYNYFWMNVYAFPCCVMLMCDLTLNASVIWTFFLAVKLWFHFHLFFHFSCFLLRELSSLQCRSSSLVYFCMGGSFKSNWLSITQEVFITNSTMAWNLQPMIFVFPDVKNLSICLRIRPFVCWFQAFDRLGKEIMLCYMYSIEFFLHYYSLYWEFIWGKAALITLWSLYIIWQYEILLYTLTLFIYLHITLCPQVLKRWN